MVNKKDLKQGKKIGEIGGKLLKAVKPEPFEPLVNYGFHTSSYLIQVDSSETCFLNIIELILINMTQVIV